VRREALEIWVGLLGGRDVRDQEGGALVRPIGSLFSPTSRLGPGFSIRSPATGLGDPPGDVKTDARELPHMKIAPHYGGLHVLILGHIFHSVERGSLKRQAPAAGTARILSLLLGQTDPFSLLLHLLRGHHALGDVDYGEDRADAVGQPRRLADSGSTSFGPCLPAGTAGEDEGGTRPVRRRLRKRRSAS
jgi:hypothetical protein